MLKPITDGLKIKNKIKNIKDKAYFKGLNMNKPKFFIEEVYNQGYDTAGNYHICGVFSGHTVIRNKLPDYMVIVQDEDGSYQPAVIKSQNDDGTVTVIMSNKDYKE